MGRMLNAAPFRILQQPAAVETFVHRIAKGAVEVAVGQERLHDLIVVMSLAYRYCAVLVT
ncbi:hypothetical protein NITMOv2_2332 [Nitrospira moscoviensis]|uniref:Uncharacterized protein n=1 Tax=Nitrospira moscoviensis TaxID=42253 RepID=A0A0K2GCS2_NITMO|nr:hypothetical protein NITMOv2_2332 [Nitrospira moscoviensis]